MQSIPQYTFLALALFLGLSLTQTKPSQGQDSALTEVKAIPSTRAETKAALEKLKTRNPRLPVPGLDMAADSASVSSSVINGRSRNYYIPSTWLKADRFGNEPIALIDYALKTQCFWVTSRGNNCHYCLGHQEHKLHLAGLTDDQIGALDRDWSSLPVRTQKAVELARRMTLLPFSINDQCIDDLRPEFTDREIIELVHAIARFNAINRWTDSLGLPQDEVMKGETVSFLSPTDSKWNQGKSLVAHDDSILRPAGWDFSTIQARWKTSWNREPRVNLASEEETRHRLSIATEMPVNDWHRAVSELVAAGPEQCAALESLLADEELQPRIKLAAMWTSARYNHAPTSLAFLYARRDSVGWAEDDFERLSRDEALDSSEIQVAMAFAKKLTCTPQRISDADIAGLKEHWNDRQTAHLIYAICSANALDRFTETLALSTRVMMEPPRSAR